MSTAFLKGFYDTIEKSYESCVIPFQIDDKEEVADKDRDIIRLENWILSVGIFIPQDNTIKDRAINYLKTRVTGGTQNERYRPQRNRLVLRRLYAAPRFRR